MTISTKRFTEIRFMISDLLQRKAWEELYDNCGTNDLDLAKSVANIFSMFDPKHVWQFVNYVLKLPADKRRERRDSTLTVSLSIGRIGQSNPRKALSSLRTLLSDDHMLRTPVEASLANIWVFDRRTTERELLRSWIQSSHENDDLQEIAVRSCDYVCSQDPKQVVPFLKKVLRLNDPKYRPAQVAAKELALKYEFGNKLLKEASSTTHEHSKTKKRKKPHRHLKKEKKKGKSRKDKHRKKKKNR